MNKIFHSVDDIKIHVQDNHLWIGEGQNSIVYLVSHINQPEWHFAMKLIDLNKNKWDHVMEEINSHSILSHPNVIQFI